jgi:hypothetical protein
MTKINAVAFHTGEMIGNIGTLKGERLHLIYQSLSGEAYATVVMFEGNGQPSSVTFQKRG